MGTEYVSNTTMDNIKDGIEKLKRRIDRLSDKNDRLRDLCILLIEGMIQDNPDEAYKYFKDIMTEQELFDFGIYWDMFKREIEQLA